MDFLDAYLDETLASFSAFCASAEHRKVMEDMAELITERFREGRKLLVCGNGGSAADAQHIACEFVSRFLFDRAPLPAIALTTDSSILTAIGNDYGYQHSFERQVLALGQEGDVLLGISTSGNSPNVLAAFTAAKSKGITCLGFTGAANNQMSSCCDMLLAAPSTKTPIIQQIHITAAHVVCALVERDMFPQG